MSTSPENVAPYEKVLCSLYDAILERQKKGESDFPYISCKDAERILWNTPGIHFKYPASWKEIFESMEQWGFLRVFEPAGLEAKVLVITKSREETYKKYKER